ncbi:uncharacterized protein LOC123546854 [Mercenaria mercenaria]|uniref:uncharacterized protein LOC123546854 n=1 Tax=Mercenaria mercenaria TaxID=6596 RepID=UPI00234EA36E|nr:uncharacterized protein LOC123546854 [Mercenaria mercenaria]
MLRLLVLIILISGVSTRGVPTADDNAELGPKEIETDQKDHSSEHDNLTDCEDCTETTEDGDDDDILPERQHEKDDNGNEGADDLKTTPKPKTAKRIKPFLTFHRINVNVNRNRKTNRKSSTKRTEKQLKTSRARTQIKEDKIQLDNNNDQIKANRDSPNSANYAKADTKKKEALIGTVDHILEGEVDESDNRKQSVTTKIVQPERFKSKTEVYSKDKSKEKGNSKHGKNAQTESKVDTVHKSEDSEKKAYSVSTEKPNDQKDTVDRIIPKNMRDRWSRKGLSQVPDVERLERRLHPTIDAPVNDIIYSMKNMIRLIQSSLYRVDVDFKMIQNTTRWKYMVGVRNQLTELSEDNDEIYDVIMDVSLLTKQIYRQAHERKHPRSNIEAAAVAYRSRINTNMHPQIRRNFQEAQTELEIAKELIKQIEGIRNKKESLIDEEMRIHHLVRDRLPMRSMHDLYRRADQTIRVLSAAQPLSRYGEKNRLYGHMRNDSALNMRRARELIVEGFDLLTHSKRTLLDNRRKVHEHGRIVRHKLPAGTVSDMPFGSGQMDLFVAWDEANHHANSLSESAAEIHMKFVPLIKKAKEIIANSAGVGFKKRLEQSLEEMKETVKMLDKTLDEIRIVVGDEGILQDRCEDIQRSSLFSVGDSPIDCDPYVQVTIQGSGDVIDGSGDDDDTFVDIEIPETNTLNVTDEKASVDVNITKPEESFIDIDMSQPEESFVDVDVAQQNDSSVDADITKPKESSASKVMIKPTSSSTDNFKDITKPNRPVQIDKTNTLKPLTASNFDGTDDEDIAQELKKKMTQRTTTTPETTTELTAETATKDPDLFFDVFGWFNDQPDEEAIVLGAVDDKTGLVVVPSNMTLNEHIRERLYNYSEGSKVLLEAAKMNRSKMEEISLTWQKVQNRFSTIENKTKNAKSVISKWKAEKAYFNAVHYRVKGVKDDIDLKKDVVEELCSDSVDVANKKLKDMNKVYKKQSEKAKNAADPTDVNQAVTQVKVVLDNVKEISRLKQLYPTPCGTLERLDEKIRFNITELRKKIERAKLIASSLQIAVAVPKKGYIEFPISDQSAESHPLTSQVQMMLKHTGSDGRLLSMHVGESESLSLEVQTDGLTVIQSIDGDESSHTLYADKIADKWYLIQLHRFAASYNFTMVGENGILGKVGLQNSTGGQRLFTQDLLPTTLRVGASGEDLSACALGIEINGRSINMFDMTDNKSFPTPCSSQGRWSSHQTHLLLDGSGYAVMSLKDIKSFRTLQSIKIAFNPRSDGTVIFLQPKRMATTIDVYVEKGLLVVFVHYRGFETKLKSTVDVYGNNQILEISFKGGRTRSANVVLNGRSNVFKSAKSGKREQRSISNNIFIGGFREENSSMVGCIKSLEINGEEVPFNIIHEAEGHSYGTCHETECVIFDDSSVPIELTNLTVVQTVHISVRRGSLGPILQYSKHKEKFNLEISLNTEGIHAEETVKENDEDFSLNGESEFIVIAIHDDTEDKSVTVTIDGESEEFTYSNGGGWDPWGNGKKDKDDDGPVSYSVSVATSFEDSPNFIGSVQNLILDERPVDLLQYVESNKLGRCTVDPVPRKTIVTDTTTKGITCQ